MSATPTRQQAIVLSAFDGIPTGETVEVVALAFDGDARTLVSHGGRLVRVPNEALIGLI